MQHSLMGCTCHYTAGIDIALLRLYKYECSTSAYRDVTSVVTCMFTSVTEHDYIIHKD
jgi:hypothetical protein